MMNTPYDKYRQSAVQTSPAQLLIMTYEGAIRFVRTALEALEHQDYEKSNVFFGKAQTIIAELTTTLDRSYEVSEGLAAMYEYMNHLLIQANIKKEKEPAEEALGYLRDLKETWYEAMKQLSSPVDSHAATSVVLNG